MLNIILIVVAVLVVALLGYPATRPDTLVVSRTATINAPPEKVFAIDFMRPFEAHNRADYSFMPTPSGLANLKALAEK